MVIKGQSKSSVTVSLMCLGIVNDPCVILINFEYDLIVTIKKSMKFPVI
jgi:hypothetical protein